MALAVALALAVPGGACDGDGGTPGGADTLETSDGEDPGPVDSGPVDSGPVDSVGSDGQGTSDGAGDTASAPDAGPDGTTSSLPACDAPQGPQPVVFFEAVDTHTVNWRAQGLTEWEGDVTVSSVEEWVSPAVGPQDGESGWVFTLDTGTSGGASQLYTFRVVLDGYHVPFAVGDSLHADLHVFAPEFYAQNAWLALTDADGALVLMAFQGVAYYLPFSITGYECADQGDCGVLQGRGPLGFDGDLTMAPALSGAVVPDRAATTVGEGDGAYLVLIHDAWMDAAPDDPPTCTDAIQSWFQFAILPAPAAQ